MKARYCVLSLLILAILVFPSCTCLETRRWEEEKYLEASKVYGTWKMTLKKIEPKLPVPSQLVGLIAPGLNKGTWKISGPEDDLRIKVDGHWGLLKVRGLRLEPRAGSGKTWAAADKSGETVHWEFSYGGGGTVNSEIGFPISLATSAKKVNVTYTESWHGTVSETDRLGCIITLAGEGKYLKEKEGSPGNFIERDLKFSYKLAYVGTRK